MIESGKQQELLKVPYLVWTGADMQVSPSSLTLSYDSEEKSARSHVLSVLLRNRKADQLAIEVRAPETIKVSIGKPQVKSIGDWSFATAAVQTALSKESRTRGLLTVELIAIHGTELIGTIPVVINIDGGRSNANRAQGNKNK